MNTEEELKWYKEYRNKILGLGSNYRPSEQELQQYKKPKQKVSKYKHRQTNKHETKI